MFWLFDHVGKQLRKKNFKSVLSQPEKQTITILILPDILRSKGNQTMKFGQLIEYEMRNTFLRYHGQNVVEKVVPDPFLKNQNWAYL